MSINPATPHGPKPKLTQWIRTAHDCPLHGLPSYTRYTIPSGKATGLKCVRCPNGPTNRKHTESDPNDPHF
jgi:hypothetical protein